jgi:hypothetical protein
MPIVETLHPREAEIRALEAMEAEVAESGAGIAPLIKSRTPAATQVLREIARIVAGDVPPQLAMTDPARYRKLARLRTEVILRGYYDYFKGLAEAG